MSESKTICWDCDKIQYINLPEEVKRKTPKNHEGDFYIICNDCGKKDDDDY